MPLRLAILAALGGCAAASPLRIHPGEDPTRVTVTARVDGLPPKTDVRDVLKIALLDEETGMELPSIFSDHSWDGTSLTLRPRYPLSRGQRYRVTLAYPGRAPVTSEYAVPPLPPGRPAQVTKIYPTTNRVPANLLKFYLHFSKPMREGKYIFDHLRILDPNGIPVHDPWRRMDLWTPEATRLTLWIHPGRVKQGVNLREEFGPVLVPGRRYTLEIGPGVLDADGRPLGRTFQKRFIALADDRTQPSLDRWKLTLPREAGTKNGLTARFPEPLDRWLLERCIRVNDPTGRPVRGSVRVGSDQRQVTFLPEEPWRPGPHEFEIDAQLEDLAGNTPERIFDTDLTAAPPTPARTRLPFRISPR